MNLINGMKLNIRTLGTFWAQHAGSAGDVTVRNYLAELMRRGRIYFRTLVSKGNVNKTITTPVSKGGPIQIPVEGAGSVQQESLVSRIVKRWVSNSQAAELRRTTARRLFATKGIPLLGLTGVCLVKKPTLLTNEEQLESVCLEIRDLLSNVSVKTAQESIPEKYDISLEDLQLGWPISKGCNAVVYSAKWKDDEKDLTEANESLSVPARILAVEENVNTVSTGDSLGGKFGVELKPHTGSLEPYNLAVKMMFNYDAESNASAIWNALNKECVPACVNLVSHNTGKKCLPPHPNIVEMKVAFADYVPMLPGAKLLYPSALPARLHQYGYGRNMTLFLVMKRYHCSLQDYLKHFKPAGKVVLSLLTQLLEGVVHMNQYGVAHRDLKSDNLLLDLSFGELKPQLAITDFGCCLAEERLEMKLPFPTEEVCRGGNAALMAPEVSTAVPGLFSSIDYEKADLWTVGTLVYELFGMENPFYKRGNFSLDSRNYSESELPSLPDCAPAVIKKLTRDMLMRDPQKRPSPSLAATVCQLLLHAPITMLSGVLQNPKDILQWLVTFTASTICEMRSDQLSFVDLQLKLVFLARVNLNQVLEALRYIKTAD